MKWLYLIACTLSFSCARSQAYFQQRVDTKLEVRLDDRRHFLHGREAFTYTNNSPDTLRFLYIHLWPNAYLHDRTSFSEQQVLQGNTDFYYSKPADRGYIDSLDMTVDGEKATLYSTDQMPDVAKMDLPKPLMPGGSIEVKTPFRVKIPKVFSRMGHAKQAYYISQWFPKPAVYDRKGWHPLPYLDFGEFFSEIGSYDVSITLPRNYIVMATGNCTDAAENEWLDSLSRIALPRRDSTHRASALVRDSLNRIPPSSAEMKTIHFREDNVHDFAFFADKRWIVRKDTFTLPGNDRPVTAWAAFLPADAARWKSATGYMKTTVQYLSREVGPYAYATVKAVEGDLKAGGGMEYPTITLIDQAASAADLKTVVVHEVGHNWFQGMLATNERDDAWMDEGVNTFYERKISASLRQDTSNKNITRKSKDLIRLLYFQGAGTGEDQPMHLTSDRYTKQNYGVDVYYKTAFMLDWLEDYMGADAFRAAMQDYFTTWRHRHPYPEDMQAAFQRHAMKPVDWFFRDIPETDRRIDFRIRKVTVKGGTAAIRLGNRSGFAAPVRINAYKGSGLQNSLWTGPFRGDTTVLLPAGDTRYWQIDEAVPDATLTNNAYRRYGFPHRSGVRLGLGFQMNDRGKRALNVFPAIGYNAYDGFMAGILIHNLSLPESNFRFILAPLYAFGSQEVTGAGSVGYFIHPRRTFREISLQADVKSFHYEQSGLNIEQPLYARYRKIAHSLTFTFKNPVLTSPVTRTLLLKGYDITEDYFSFHLDPADSLYRPSKGGPADHQYGLLRYAYTNSRTFNPYSYMAEIQAGPGFAKINLEGRLRIDYNQKGKALHIRAYAGKFISWSADPFATERYWLNTTFNGPNDYLYDDTYIGRNERSGIGYQQISVQEGGFKLPTDFYASRLGRSDDWLAALNLKSDLPLGRLPIRLFLDLGTFAHADKLNPSGDKVLYMAGVELHLLNDFFLLHVPLLLSSDYNDYLKSIYPKNRLSHSITFSIQLQHINWLKAVEGGLRFLN